MPEARGRGPSTRLGEPEAASHDAGRDKPEQRSEPDRRRQRVGGAGRAARLTGRPGSVGPRVQARDPGRVSKTAAATPIATPAAATDRRVSRNHSSSKAGKTLITRDPDRRPGQEVSARVAPPDAEPRQREQPEQQHGGRSQAPARRSAAANAKAPATSSHRPGPKDGEPALGVARTLARRRAATMTIAAPIVAQTQAAAS